MRYRLAAPLALLVCAVLGCSGPQTGEAGAHRALDAAAEAMGGWEALRSVRTVRIESAGSNFEPWQAMAPGETVQVNNFTSTYTAQFAQPAVRVEFQADILWPREYSVEYTEVIQGEAGMLEQPGANGVQQSRLHPARYAARIRDLKRSPVRVLLTASEGQELDRQPDVFLEGVDHQTIYYQDAGQRVELIINSETHLPARVSYLEDDPIIGDNWNQIFWSDWREVGGVMLPHSIEQRINERTTHKETVREMEINPSFPAAAFAIPEAIRQTPEEGERIVSSWVPRRVASNVSYLDFGRPPRVVFEELARGVWEVGVASHQTFVIEMRDHLITVEAPLYEERSQAVIAGIKEKFPAKPIRYTVATHWHLDHSGGLRAYAAEGATIVAHASILPFLREMFARPKTVRPDALARRVAAEGKLPDIAIEGVDEIQEYTDGARVVRLYPVPTMHARGFLSVYLPRERIIIEADLVSPTALQNPPIVEPRAREYYEWIRKSGLAVEQIGRVHGEAVPFREFAAVVERTR